MNSIKFFLASLIAALWLVPSASRAALAPDDFVYVKGTRFFHGSDKRPYYYVGTNMWYAPILASKAKGGDRARLHRELDSLQALGVDNLRILVGADAGSANANTVKPELQSKSGKLDKKLLKGLDYLLAELGKREMRAVLYLTNSWDWSGGWGYYLRATGHGDSPSADGEGYNDYCEYVQNFMTDRRAQELFEQHIRNIVTRRNSVTGKLYADDPAIMSWQLCNEPRPFSKKLEREFVDWVRRCAKLIKTLDKRHLVSTGSEGVIGCNVNAALCEEVHALPEIDYMTVHIWPVNWRWATPDRLYDALGNVYQKASDYLEEHNRIAGRINKPYVVEEFGYSRDNTMYGAGSSTTARDAFYNFIFTNLVESKAKGGPMAGCNFWGWGGEGRPAEKVWKPGADYLCDPPHEPQGWYSVYNSDTTTCKLIKQTNEALRR